MVLTITIIEGPDSGNTFQAPANEPQSFGRSSEALPMIRPIATLAAALPITTAASAHEFWISPSTFLPEPGVPFRVTLMHGERFAGEPVPRNDLLFRRYELLCNGDAGPVRGLSGKTTGYAKVPGGWHWLISVCHWLLASLCS